jgi:hypothetical protein
VKENNHFHPEDVTLVLFCNLFHAFFYQNIEAIYKNVLKDKVAKVENGKKPVH